MGSSELVQFSDWSGGDEGRSRPIKYDPTRFRGVNVWQYPSGGIGPRPPFQLTAISGLPQKALRVFHVLRPGSGGTATQFMFGFSDGTIYKVPATTLTATLMGTMTNPPVDAVSIGDTAYFVSDSGSGAKCSATGTFANVAALPVGDLIEQLASRTVIANAGTGGSLPGILRVSAPDDPDTWPAANAIEIGAPDQLIMGLYVQRRQLVMPKIDGTLWVLRNVPTVNETLLQEDTSGFHPLPRRAPGAVTSQSNLWFCVDRDMVRFTGAAALLEPRPDIPVVASYNVNVWSNNVGTVAPLTDDDEFMVVGTIDQTADTNIKKVWAHGYKRGGGWTRHSVPIDPFRVTYPTESSKDNSTAIKLSKAAVGGVLVLCTGSDTALNSGRAPRIYAFNSRQEYPHIPTGDVNTNNVGSSTLNDGDSSAPVIADVRLAEHWDLKGRMLTVTHVVVDYSYNPNITPLSTHNKFDLSVEALQAPGSTTVTASASVTFTPSGTGSAPDGSPFIRGEERFGFGDQGSGLGFRVRLADWRGILVHRIVVHFDASDQAR